MTVRLVDTVRAWIADKRICKDRILGAVSSDGQAWRRFGAPCIDVRQKPPFDDEMVYGCWVWRTEQHGFSMLYQSSKQTGDGWHSRILSAVSADGAEWRTPRPTGVERGAHRLCARRVQSPHLVRIPGGWIMYFSGTAEDGIARILTATSADGTDWRIDDRPALEPAQFGALGMPVSALMDPSVVSLPDGAHRIYLTAQLGGDFRQAIVSACSGDGRSWIPDHGFRIRPGDRGMQEVANNPSVLAEGGHYRMWFRGSDCFPLDSSIFLALSENSIDWTVKRLCLKAGRYNRYEGQGVAFPFVMKDGDEYRMYYAGYWGNLLCGETVGNYRRLHALRRAAAASGDVT